MRTEKDILFYYTAFRRIFQMPKPIFSGFFLGSGDFFALSENFANSRTKTPLFPTQYPL